MPDHKLKPRVPTRSEKEVTREVLEVAAMLGVDLKRRNVGAFTNPSGRLVRCGEAGDSDWYATLPGGRSMSLELKKESFDPIKARGKDRERFVKQLEKLREVNRLGGVGFWTRDSGDFLDAMRRILDGWSVEIGDDGYCFVISPDERRPADLPGQGKLFEEQTP